VTGIVEASDCAFTFISADDVVSVAMSPDIYQRVSQDDTDFPVKVTQIHSSTSYHDNEYDEASDQDSLLAKDDPPSPGLAEHGDGGSRRSRTTSSAKPVCD
jgi:hypothetical protein